MSNEIEKEINHQVDFGELRVGNSGGGQNQIFSMDIMLFQSELTKGTKIVH